MQEKHHTLPGRQVPVLLEVDVAVVGGGFPGVCAALAAARLGAQVALLERDGLLGGQAVEVYTFGLTGFTDNHGKQFVKGIPWEIVQKTVAEGQSDPVWHLVDYDRMEREGRIAELHRLGGPMKNDTYLNPNAFRHVLQTLVDEAGIVTLLETPLSDVLLEGNRVRGVVGMGCYGPFAVEARVVVDTTPQAAVAALAGHSFAFPQAYTGTHPRVAGVDIHRLLAWALDHPDDVKILGADQTDRIALEAMVARDMGLRFMGFAAVRRAAMADDPAYEITGMREARSFVFQYERDGCGMYWIHSPEWRNTRLDDPLLLSRTLSEMRKRQWLTHKLFREYVPGFEKAHLMDVHPHIARALNMTGEPGGFTEYDVPWEHMQKGGDLYEDSLVHVMGHHDMGESPSGWQLPYRSLIPKGLEGLLVTGKPASRFLHVHGTNSAVGQAAGVAAAVAVQTGVPLRELDVARVQEALKEQGAVVF